MFRRLPFDWQTPAGYVVCILIQISIVSTVGQIFSAMATITIGLCLFAVGLASDLEENLFRIEIDMSVAEDKPLSPRQIIGLKEKIADFMVFHGEAREYELNFHS